MGTSFEKLISHLKIARELGPPTTTRFREFNVDEVARALDLDEKARLRATSPASGNPNSPDDTELSVVAFIREAARSASSQFHGALDTYEARLRDASIDEAAFVMIKAAGEEGMANFHAQSVEDRLPLQRVADDARRTLRQFEVFVTTNRLQDTAPIIVEPRAKASAFLWIVALACVESIINGLFFATGSQTGFIGGITEALSLSVINMAIASVIGLFSLRYIRHVAMVWRITALLSLIVLALLAVAFNGLIAHYREAFQLMAETGSYGASPDFRGVLNSFLNDPFELRDAKSWLLGLIGVVMNCIAAWKFLSLNDPYPGFGQLASRRRDVLQQLSQVRKNCIQALTDHRNYAVDQMESVISKLSSRKSEFEVVLRSRSRLTRDFEEHLRMLGELCTRLSYRYRAIAGIEAPPLEPHLSSQLELPPVYTQDSSAHSRAIESMDGYLSAVSSHYTNSVKMVGESSDLHTLGIKDA
jgi:hypothetical protein